MSKRYLLSGKELNQLLTNSEIPDEHKDYIRNNRLVVPDSDKDIVTDIKLCNKEITERDTGLNLDKLEM